MVLDVPEKLDSRAQISSRVSFIFLIFLLYPRILVDIKISRTIPMFLYGVSTPDSLTWRNRHNVIGFMRSFAEPGSNLLLQETTVLAWGQIARQVL